MLGVVVNIRDWMCCDAQAGFCHQMEVYLGKGVGMDVSRGLGYSVVRKLTKPLRNQDHHIYFDNLFTSVGATKDNSVYSR